MLTLQTDTSKEPAQADPDGIIPEGRNVINANKVRSNLKYPVGKDDTFALPSN